MSFILYIMSSIYIIVIHPCESGPCNNEGMCVPVDSLSYMCVCLAGYTGPVCETKIDNCLHSNCTLDTSCLNGNNTPQCITLEAGDSSNQPSKFI